MDHIAKYFMTFTKKLILFSPKPKKKKDLLIDQQIPNGIQN